MMNDRVRVLISILAVVVLWPALSRDQTVQARQFHVSVTGSEKGSGSLRNPWSLALPLYHPPTIAPGDTILVHGGTYVGHFESWLKGTPARPIVVKNYNGERVVLSVLPGNPNVTFFIKGDYTWYCGLEIMSATMDTVQVNAAAVFLAGRSPSEKAKGNKLINCVIHDATGNGVGDQHEAEGTEIYGCLIYYNGRKTNNSNYAYAIYGQNNGRLKVYSENFFFANYGGYALHMYTESGSVDSFRITHNAIFSGSGGSANMMFNEAGGASGISVDSNFFYGPSSSSTLYQERKAMIAPVIRGNVFANGRLSFRSSTLNRLFSGNICVGDPPILTTSGESDRPFDIRSVPGNTWYGQRGFPRKPGGVTSFIRKNKYDPKRANVIVYNWDSHESIRLDPSQILKKGQSFDLRDVQNFFGPPVLSGVYDGGMLTLPMNRTAVATPVSYPSRKGKPQHTGKEFGAFVLTIR